MYFLPGLPANFDPHGVSSRRAALPASFGNGRTARTEGRTERPAFEAANSSFFDTFANREFFHQRRCSTADESGLPDKAN